jgi:hypothetical protein
LDAASHSHWCHENFRLIQIRPRVGNPSGDRDAAPICQPPHRCCRSGAADGQARFGNLLLHDGQDLVAEPDDGIHIRKIIHHPGKNDRSGPLGDTARTEIVEVYSVTDETDRHPRNQALKVALLGCRVDERVREGVG